MSFGYKSLYTLILSTYIHVYQVARAVEPNGHPAGGLLRAQDAHVLQEGHLSEQPQLSRVPSELERAGQLIAFRLLRQLQAHLRLHWRSNERAQHTHDVTQRLHIRLQCMTIG